MLQCYITMSCHEKRAFIPYMDNEVPDQTHAHAHPYLGLRCLLKKSLTV